MGNTGKNWATFYSIIWSHWVPHHHPHTRSTKTPPVTSFPKTVINTGSKKRTLCETTNAKMHTHTHTHTHIHAYSLFHSLTPTHVFLTIEHSSQTKAKATSSLPVTPHTSTRTNHSISFCSLSSTLSQIHTNFDCLLPLSLSFSFLLFGCLHNWSFAMTTTTTGCCCLISQKIGQSFGPARTRHFEMSHFGRRHFTTSRGRLFHICNFLV